MTVKVALPMQIRAALIGLLGPARFHRLRRWVVLGRHRLGVVYDPDLRLVSDLPTPRPLLVDVGANAGQSALCMGMLRPDARIISFEASPANLDDLARIRAILGPRYTFHHVGLSDTTGRGILRTPVVGQTPIPGEASFSDLDPLLHRRLGAITGIVEQSVDLRPFDSFDLKPDFIKIDVQGHELEVIRGMDGTLEGSRPTLLIERERRFDEVRAHLRGRAYEVVHFDPRGRILERCDSPPGLNYVALPRERLPHSAKGR